MRLAAAVEERDLAKLSGLETIWRDPSTPTRQAMADATTKTLAAGISDLHQARVDYGYSAGTIQAMEDREAKLNQDPFEPPETPDAGAVAAEPAAAGL
jgi:hypothetical protein